MTATEKLVLFVIIVALVALGLALDGPVLR